MTYLETFFALALVGLTVAHVYEARERRLSAEAQFDATIHIMHERDNVLLATVNRQVKGAATKAAVDGVISWLQAKTPKGKPS